MSWYSFSQNAIGLECPQRALSKGEVGDNVELAYLLLAMLKENIFGYAQLLMFRK